MHSAPLTPGRTLVLALVLATSTVHAEIPLELSDRGASRITLDGLLRDWSSVASLTAVDEPARILRGAAAWHGPDDCSFGYALATDPDALYLAAEVRDDVIVRSAAHRDGEDSLVVSLAVQAGGHPVGYDLAIFPGEPGAFSGSVRFTGARSSPVPGATVVEAPLPGGGGYTLEARIPWRSMPEILPGRSTLRGRIAYLDTDTPAHPATETVLATGPGDGQHPMDLPAAAGAVGDVGPGNLLNRFQMDHDVGSALTVLDRAANLAGDPQQERLVLFPRYLVAFGPGIAGGRGYVFAELPSRATADVLESDVRDVTGDGRADVVLRLRAPGTRFDRELLQVYAVDDTGALQRVLDCEVGRSEGSLHRLTDRVTWEPGNSVRISVGSAQGFTAETFPPVVESGVETPVTPWGPDRARVYTWNATDRRFTLARTEPNPTAARPAAPVASPATEAPPPDAPPPADVQATLALFREREHIAPDARPGFQSQADVAEDPTRETVLIYGRSLVVVGPHFMGGRSYYTMALPVESGEDVRSLRLVDLTGDGRAEAVVRVRRRLQAQIQGQAVPVEKELLLVYGMEPPHRGRILGVEVSRRVGEQSITNEVDLPAATGDLTVATGTAHGWSVETYPFHDGAPQGIEPLMLPWESPHRRTFHWNGTALAPVP